MKGAKDSNSCKKDSFSNKFEEIFNNMAARSFIQHQVFFYYQYLVDYLLVQLSIIENVYNLMQFALSSRQPAKILLFIPHRVL